MIAKLTKVTRTYIHCPSCGEQTGSSVDHLPMGIKFGPWYCDKCNKSYVGEVEPSGITIELHTEVKISTVSLLKRDGEVPVYFLVEGFSFKDDIHEINDSSSYFYEEHSCPINWLRDVFMVIEGSDTDPHGFLEHVRTITMEEYDKLVPDERNLQNNIEEVSKAFPEIKK